MKRWLSIRLNEGECPPWIYGFAWSDFARKERIYIPVPLNLIAGFTRRTWWFLRRGFRDPEVMRLRARVKMLESRIDAGR